MNTVGVGREFVVDRFDGVITGGTSDFCEGGIGHPIDELVNGR